MHSNRSFNQWIRQRRRFLNLRQAELADLVGCSVSTEQKFEDGSRRPSKQIAELLAIHLQIPEAEKAAFLRAAREIEGTEIAVVKDAVTKDIAAGKKSAGSLSLSCRSEDR